MSAYIASVATAVIAGVITGVILEVCKYYIRKWLNNKND